VAGALVVRGLRKSFGANRAVDDVSLELEVGHVHSLIGPNGAGKTTVFNCLSGFLRPDSGHVFLKDREVTGWPPHRLVAAGLARTFQITRVFGELSVIENVELAARSRLGRNLDFVRRAADVRAARAVAEEVLGTLGLRERAAARADELGHGDRRVLEVAIGLALTPDVLLLDEPTAGMSRAETEGIAALVRRIAGRVSVLLVEHDTEMVLAVSDVITVMTQGRVIAHGTPEQVSRDPRVRDAYLGAIEART
jgi:branched-chain amino acid transport system ATP-binding protein